MSDRAGQPPSSSANDHGKSLQPFKGLTLDPTVGAKTEDMLRADRPNVYKSFLATRLLVGAVGILLPAVLIIAGAALNGSVRGSLSAYYHDPSWLHAWFIGSLWAIGVGLMVYMGTRKSSLAGFISTLAGLCALLVSLIPTDDGAPRVSETHPGAHFIFAAVVVGGLGVLCFGFGIDDKMRAPRDANAILAKKFYWVHWVATGLIGLGIVIAILAATDVFWPSHGVLFGEALAILAFGVSWFLKGAEIWFSEKMRKAIP